MSDESHAPLPFEVEESSEEVLCQQGIANLMRLLNKLYISPVTPHYNPYLQRTEFQLNEDIVLAVRIVILGPRPRVVIENNLPEHYDQRIRELFARVRLVLARMQEPLELTSDMRVW